ncbi:MAG: hypothetical protein N3D85_01700 [Candidatus Bathyarchaeota archaeon]|nr:hypothetical protein [Candidatus Bathyarchaeota archaeon]
MVKDNVLIAITVSRDKEEIVYQVDCAHNLLDEEIEYYLSEIIKGLCMWKPSICKEHSKTLKTAIKKKEKE